MFDLGSSPPNRRYCSTTCRTAAENRRYEARRAQDPARKRACEKCNSEFAAMKPTSRYCSRSCAARSRPVRERPAGLNTRRQGGPCRHCGQVTSKRNTFCDRECYRASLKTSRADRLAEWIAGNTPADAARGRLLASARQHLLEEAGYACTECGWNKPNPALGRPILTVDHIDGDWTNNYKNNLKVLCYNCHTLTDTFCFLNRSSEPGARFYVSARIIEKAIAEGFVSADAGPLAADLSA